MRVYDKVEYNKYIKSLTGEYKACYEKIEGYLKLCYSGNNESEEKCVYQILGELMAAQGCYKPISMVIGKNLREYCDGYINKHQASNAKFLKSLQNVTIYVTLILVLMVIKGFRVYPDDFLNNLNFGILELMVLLYAIVWNVVRVFIARAAMSKNKWVKGLDIYLNVFFIMLLLPVISLNLDTLSFGIKVPFIALVAVLIVLALILTYTIKMQKANVKENEDEE